MRLKYVLFKCVLRRLGCPGGLYAPIHISNIGLQKHAPCNHHKHESKCVFLCMGGRQGWWVWGWVWVMGGRCMHLACTKVFCVRKPLHPVYIAQECIAACEYYPGYTLKPVYIMVAWNVSFQVLETCFKLVSTSNLFQAPKHLVILQARQAPKQEK